MTGVLVSLHGGVFVTNPPSSRDPFLSTPPRQRLSERLETLVCVFRLLDVTTRCFTDSRHDLLTRYGPCPVETGQCSFHGTWTVDPHPWQCPVVILSDTSFLKTTENNKPKNIREWTDSRTSKFHSDTGTICNQVDVTEDWQQNHSKPMYTHSQLPVGIPSPHLRTPVLSLSLQFVLG